MEKSNLTASKVISPILDHGDFNLMKKDLKDMLHAFLVFEESDALTLALPDSDYPTFQAKKMSVFYTYQILDRVLEMAENLSMK